MEMKGGGEKSRGARIIRREAFPSRVMTSEADDFDYRPDPVQTQSRLVKRTVLKGSCDWDLRLHVLDRFTAVSLRFAHTSTFTLRPTSALASHVLNLVSRLVCSSSISPVVYVGFRFEDLNQDRAKAVRYARILMYHQHSTFSSCDVMTYLIDMIIVSPCAVRHILGVSVRPSSH
jgi:hypothetical protein